MSSEMTRSDLATALSRVTAATASALLLRQGLSRVTMEGVKPLVLRPGVRIAGPACTLRYLPMREDKPPEAQPTARLHMQAVDAMQPGDVLVADALGDLGCGIIGDVIASRAKAAGAAGLVVDGAVRDLPGLTEVGLTIFARGAHPAPSKRTLWPVEMGQPVACGGVLVCPGDWILADADAVVVIPAALAPEVAHHGLEHEEHDLYSRKLVEAGFPLSEAYPPNPELEAAYQEYLRTGRLPRRQG